MDLAVDTETAGLHGAFHRVGWLTSEGATGWGGGKVPWKRKLKALMKRADRIVGFNIKYDAHVLGKLGVDLPWEKVHDPLLMASLLLGNERKSLLDLGLKYLDYDGEEDLNVDDYCKEHKVGTDYSQVPDELLKPYTHKQLFNTLVLDAMWEQHVPQEAYELERRLVPVLYRMEERGIRVDVDALEKARPFLEEEIRKATARMRKATWASFSPGSPAQVGEALKTVYSLDLPKTPTGQAATGEAIIAPYAEGIPFVKDVLLCRHAGKLLSTYLNSLIEKVGQDGILHGSFAQTITRTGRLSSSDPNLQNFAGDALILNAFVPREGLDLYTLDYSQIEFRLAVFLSGDTNGVAEYERGLDFHTASAINFFGDASQRSRAKTLNFAILYGMGRHALARALGVSVAAASALLQRFFQHYDGIATLKKKVLYYARRTGTVPLSNGRVLRLGPKEYHKAFNYLIQGEAAIVMKRAMIHLDKFLPSMGGAWLVSSIHDENWIEAEEPACLKEAVEVMKLACQYPMDVEVKRWDGSWANEVPVTVIPF